MDRGSTGKVKATQFVDPAIWVPCPTGDCIVDDRGPDEHEDNAWKHTTALGHSTDSKGHTNYLRVSIRRRRKILRVNLRDRGEHALIDCEHEIRYAFATHRGLCQDIVESEV